jgi:hypothetical protein
VRVVFVSLLAAACGADPGDGPDTDPAAGGDTSGSNSPAPTYAPTFSAIYTEVFVAKRCTLGLCHGEGASGGGLDLYPRDDAYRNLVAVPATSSECREMGLLRVAPGAPENSLLLHKLSAEPPGGVMMPPDQVVESRHVEQIAEWIRRGAPNE